MAAFGVQPRREPEAGKPPVSVAGHPAPMPSPLPAQTIYLSMEGLEVESLTLGLSWGCSERRLA